jgi:hypothetical protein
VRYEELEKELPVSERGVNMLQLRDAVARRGLPSVIRRYTASEQALLHLSLPLIARINKGSLKLGERHYVVVVNIVQEGEKRGI